MCISDGTVPYIFQSKNEDGAACEEKNGGKMFISHFHSVDILIKVLYFSLYLDLVCKQLCFPPSNRYKYEKRNYCCKSSFISL